MKEFLRSSQKGQSLILVAIFSIALLAMLALIIDGGNSYLKRRQAQNAADAAALAGARIYCSDPSSNYDDAITEATNFVAYNHAVLQPGDNPSITDNGSSVTVTVGTTITFDTFFASILGQPQSTANAIAEAGCHGACLAEGVLPVVWICKREGGAFPPGVNVDCEDLPIPWDTLQGYLKDPPETPEGDPLPLDYCTYVDGANKADHKWVCPEMTIVIDNIDVDNLQCDSVGGILDCDFDEPPDGIDDYISSDNRGWADLDGGPQEPSECNPLGDNGGEGSGELGYWIENGYDCDFWNHTWVGDQSGSAPSILFAIDARINADPVEGRIILLPVFDASCPSDPTDNDDCIWHDDLLSPPHPGPDDLVHLFPDDTNYYHIDHFSLFYITCVQTVKGECPGATKFYEDNWGLFHGGQDPLKGGDYNAVEGYFLTEFLGNLHGKCDYDPDAPFTLYLDK